MRVYIQDLSHEVCRLMISVFLFSLIHCIIALLEVLQAPFDPR